MLRKIWVVIGVAALSPGSFGTTFTVDQSGAGGAFTTLQAAVNAAAADPATPHTIHVVDGATYIEDVFITNNPLAGGSLNLNESPDARSSVALPATIKVAIRSASNVTPSSPTRSIRIH